MSNYFSYRFKLDFENRQSLVIFCHSDVEVSTLTKVIKDDVNENLVPQRLILIGYEVNSEVKEDLNSDTLFGDEIESWIGDVEEKVSYLNVTPEGRIIDIDSGEDVSFRDELLKDGAKSIFENRKGLITSLPSYHFLKPSGDHCDKFIRASNLFTSGVEVAFLAIGLLPYLKPNIKRIYVDTSSISFLVSSAIQLYSSFDEKLPIIESFESYSVFNNPYDFHVDDDSLVIISATTSGGLAQILTEKHAFNPSNVITLFYSSIKEGQNAIYDISGAVGKIHSVRPNRCQLCEDGSKLIKIEGEQFIPETPKHELLVIRKRDFDEDRKKFFKEFATKNLLKFNTSPCDRWDKEHFFVDVKALLSSGQNYFQKSLLRKINKHFSRDIKTVIYLDDDDALFLAEQIVKIVNDDAIKVVCYQDISEQDLISHSSVLVVASAITSGRKLLATARKLRGISESATITYLVCFCKLPTSDSFGQLKNDLCLGGHELISLRSCYMPRFSENMLSPWDIEEKALSEFDDKADPFNVQHAELPNLLLKRLDILRNSSNQNELFLRSPKGESLTLRNTFAFWAGLGLDTSNSSQADVYWTIQAILHDLRLKNDKGLATTYHSTLLSPVCFDRFNDGVIQACLLRAAKPTELNYAVEEEYSRQITDIIISIVKNFANSQGEGGLEFLMAIWVGRLKTQDKHMEEIIALKDEVSSEDVIFLLNQIKTNYK